MPQTPSSTGLLVARATATTYPTTGTTGGTSSGTDEFISLIASPFASSFSIKSIVSATIFSLAVTALLTIIFSLLRPYHNLVYAPRAKYSDSEHAPPPVRRGLFGWARTIINVHESELVEKLGLDAALYMRFIRMMRNIFSILTFIGCGVLIPTNLIKSASFAGFITGGSGFFFRLTPEFLFGPIFYIYVVVAYIFNVVICYFLWCNYRAVLQLRRQYFASSDYQRSLSSRTLLITDLPRDLRSDEGIVRIVQQARATPDVPRTTVGRNVRDLPDLLEEHQVTVRKLEKILAKYLKNPNKLPATRPTCHASKKDKNYTKGQNVDAIEYLTARIAQLEAEINRLRESVDKRDAMPYGFASYPDIAEAHGVAYAARSKGPQGTRLRLAPRPQDLIWKNLPLTKKTRDWQNFINNLWVALLTVLWVVPNVLIAVFLTNLTNLGHVWPAFNTSLFAHPTLWSLVQGILSPAITTAFYFYLPKLFRLLVTRAGDVTRTSRERHVTSKLFSFFLFNNLIVFSLFSAVWSFVAGVIRSTNDNGESAWQAIKSNHPFSLSVITLINLTPYWMAWLLQRNLGAALDLSQLVTLLWSSIQRRFLSPTPRELIELTAPQPFDYASYYNYSLFYAAVTLCFGCLQPLVLPITALYFWMDSFSKKYLLLYIFVTKYESGGMFWRPLFNRILISTMLANLVIAMLVAVKSSSWAAVAVMGPLPFLLVGFKVYCMRTFDGQFHFYSEGSDFERTSAGTEHKRNMSDRVSAQFGNPLLLKPLITPMVAAKSRHLLKQVYTGRTSVDETRNTAGYGDVYMDSMDHAQPGKTAVSKTSGAGPFALVDEDQLDYEHWRHDANFTGGEESMFGQSGGSVSRPNTPFNDLSSNRNSRASSPSHNRYSSVDSDLGTCGGVKGGFTEVQGVDYPRGYHRTPSSALREHSPAAAGDSSFGHPVSRGAGGAPRIDRKPLVANAARMGRSPPLSQQQQQQAFPAPGSYDRMRITPGEDYPGYTPGEDDGASYDYFRRGRLR